MKKIVAAMLLVACSALAVAQSPPRLEDIVEANVDPPRGHVGTPYERRVCLNAASFVLSFRLHAENAFGGAGVFWIVDAQTHGPPVASVYASRRPGFTVEGIDAFYLAKPQCFLVSAMGGPARPYRVRANR